MTLCGVLVAELQVLRKEIEAEKLDIDLDIGEEKIYNNAIDDVLAVIDGHIKLYKWGE